MNDQATPTSTAFFSEVQNFPERPVGSPMMMPTPLPLFCAEAWLLDENVMTNNERARKTTLWNFNRISFQIIKKE
jgi:hypothetical protein